MDKVVEKKKQMMFFNQVSRRENGFFPDVFNHDSIEENKKDIVLFHVEKITFGESERTPRREAFENVLGTINDEGVNFVYLILGDGSSVSFYIGVVRDVVGKVQPSTTINEIGTNYLKASMEGNFRGSKIRKLSNEEYRDVFQQIKESRRFGTITGIPGVNETDDDNNFQGVDRLVDTMLRDRFGLCIIAKPLSDVAVRNIENTLYQIYDFLSLNAKNSVQEGVNSNISHGDTSGESTSKTEGRNESTAKNKSKSASIGENHSQGTSFSMSASKSDADSKSFNVTHGTSTGGSKTTNNSYSEQSEGTNWGQNKNRSFGRNYSNTNGTSATSGTNKGDSYSKNKSKSIGKTTTTGTSSSETTGENSSTTDNMSFGGSVTVSKEYSNKRLQDWMKYIDEVLFPMVNYGRSKGMYLTNIFFFSDEKMKVSRLGSTIKSLFSSKSDNKMFLKMELLEENDRRIDYFKNFQVPQLSDYEIEDEQKRMLTLQSNYCGTSGFKFGNWYSLNELSLIAGFPQREVVGLKVKEEVDFGLNVGKMVNDEDSIVLGNLIQSGNELDKQVTLSKKDLNKHMFITGVTGTGKTTTCQRLLVEAGVPFMVIEPAKTEYRIMIDREETRDLLIFTLGKDTVAPFRLNPFEFLPHESITSRVDMLKAAMEASFEMEAAIPQLLESAMYECYKDYGWDIRTNKNSKFPDPFAKGVYSFPTLEDLLGKIESEVEKQGFDARLKNDYIGSIRARLQGLLVGAKGLMLNVGRGIDFREILDRKVVLEIEEIKSGNEKSLIMGFIMTNLLEALKARYKEDRNFRHITLVEEAHRLLSKYQPGDSPNKRQGVEVFADMIAEVRKYGESLVIVDQIPNKMTPEVLKNTNTKIVHKIFANDDKDVIGNTMALTDEQKGFLSSLETGRAIVFSQGWEKALQVQIKYSGIEDRYIEDEELEDRIIDFYHNNNIIVGLKYLQNKPTREQFEQCKLFTAEFKDIKIFKKQFEKDTESYEEFLEYMDFIQFTGCKDFKMLLSKNEDNIPNPESFVNQVKKKLSRYSMSKFADVAMEKNYGQIEDLVLTQDIRRVLEIYLCAINEITDEFNISKAIGKYEIQSVDRNRLKNNIGKE